MRNFTLFLLLFGLSCSVKQTESLVASGDYDSAIENAVHGLRKNKDKKGKQDFVYLLEEAFQKAKERDLRDIDLWAKDASPRNLERIFSTYVLLNNRQESIRPLLPLKLHDENRMAQFEFDDYSEQIINSKNALSKYLYDNTRALLMTTDKMSHRRAYDDLLYLEQINPDYKDVRELTEQARFKGTDFVHIYIKNETGMLIPKRLQDDLFNFTTNGLNDKWTVYHSNKLSNVHYDYGVIVNFRNINISPEHIRERQFTAEREIIDGKRKLLDRRGNEVRDSLGNVVMVDVIKKVRASVIEFTQQKSVQLTAKIDYINFNNNELLQSYPLASEFAFQNIYARFRGDRRAVEDPYQPLFDRRAMPFPSNEQMVYDTGEDLKAKLKSILSRNKIQR